MAMLKKSEVYSCRTDIPVFLRDFCDNYDELDNECRAWFVVMFVQHMYALHSELGFENGGDIDIPKRSIVNQYASKHSGTIPMIDKFVSNLITTRHILCHAYYKECALQRLDDLWFDMDFIDFLKIHGINVNSEKAIRKEDIKVHADDSTESIGKGAFAAALAKMTGEDKGE